MARRSSDDDDVDPRRMDLRVGKRARKTPSKPDPHPLNLARKDKALARLRKMEANPGVKIVPKGEHGWRPESPHSDDDLWDAQIALAFGTNSHSLASLFLRQLKDLCAKVWTEKNERWKPSELELNAALAMVNDIQPRNSLEAALAAQMVATHWMQMNLSRDALNGGHMVLERSAALASKLARTYTMQLDQLRLMRGGKRPTIRQAIKVTRETHYHQHQHLHDHRDRGAKTIEGQSHELAAATTDKSQALRGPEPGGQVVPLPSRARSG